MKQCYFCNQSIPMDAKKCPMCGMDVNEEQSLTPEIENQTYNINFNPVSRKEEKRFSFLKDFSTFSEYLHYLTRKVTHPQETDFSTGGSSLYGYLTILISTLLAAGTATRVAATWEQTYQTLASISILPVVSFSFNANSFTSTNIPSLVSFPLANCVAAQELTNVDNAVAPIQAAQDFTINSFLFIFALVLQRFQKFYQVVFILH